MRTFVRLGLAGAAGLGLLAGVGIASASSLITPPLASEPAPAPGTTVGRCTGPVVTGEVSELPFVWTSTPSGTVASASLHLAATGDVSDLVVGLSLGETMVGVWTGTATDGGASFDVVFDDTATTDVEDAAQAGTDVSGTHRPAEPLGTLTGADSSQVWSLDLLNAGETGVTVTTCRLTLQLDGATASPTPTTDPTPTPDPSPTITPSSTPTPTSPTPSSTSSPIPGATTTAPTVGPTTSPTGSAAPTTPTATPTTRPSVAAAGLPRSGPGSPGGGALAMTGATPWLLGAGAGLVIAGLAILGLSRCRTRPGVAAALVVAVLSASLMTPPAPAVALAALEPPPHPWGLLPDGRAVVKAAGGLDVEFGGGLFTVPLGCFDLDCLTRLTSDDRDADPSVSPSGRLVAFTRIVADEGEEGRYLHVLDLMTGDVRRATFSFRDDRDRLQTRVDGSPTWSPDEQWIAFGGLEVVPAAGGAPRRLLDGFRGDLVDCQPGFGDRISVSRSTPTWGSDGRIYYMRSESNEPFFGSCRGPSRLYSTTLSGGGEVGPIGELTDLEHLDISPDATTVATFRPVPVEGEDRDRLEQVLVSTQSGDVVSTVTEFGFRMRWSPAGTHLVVNNTLVRPDGTVFTEDYSTQLFDVDADLQCSPGNCLSGIVLRVEAPTSPNVTGAVQASGALTGVLPGPEYLFARRAPGSHAVSLTALDAVVRGVTCSDEDTVATTGSITYTVGLGELVTCVVDLGAAGDADGDNIPDDIDPCPTDPTNLCELDVDTDGDGEPDRTDPCPLDPTNSCDPDPVERCRPYDVTIAADTRGIEWFQFGVSGSLCPEDLPGTERITASGSGEVTLPADIAFALDSFASVQYDPDANGAGVRVDDDGTVTATGAFDICALPLGALGKVSVKLVKLLEKLPGWAGRLVEKGQNAVGDFIASGIETAAGNLDGLAGEFTRAVADIARDQGVTGLLELNICVPLWQPTIEVAPGNAVVGYTVTGGGVGPFTERLVNATNAVG